MPRYGRHPGRTQFITGRLRQKVQERMRERLALHSLSLPDLMEIVLRHATAGEMEALAAKKPKLLVDLPVGRGSDHSRRNGPQFAFRITPMAQELMRERLRDHAITTPDLLELVVLYGTDRWFRSLISRDDHARADAAKNGGLRIETRVRKDGVKYQAVSYETPVPQLPAGRDREAPRRWPKS